MVINDLQAELYRRTLRKMLAKILAVYFYLFSITIFAFGQNVAEIDTLLSKITTEQGFSGAKDFGHHGIIKTYADGTVVIVLSNAGEIGEKLARNVAIEGIEAIAFK